MCCECGDAGSGGVRYGEAMLSESASWILPCGVGEYGPDACLYVMWDIVLVLDSLDADLRVFNFLSAYVYDIYFSIIVFKLALKTLAAFSNSSRHRCLRIAAIATYVGYQLLLAGAFIYTVIVA